MWPNFEICSNRRDRFRTSRGAMTGRCGCDIRVIKVLFILFFTSLVSNVVDLQKIEILDVQANPVYTSCDNVTLTCTVHPKNSIVWWTAGVGNLTGDDRYFEEGDVIKYVLYLGCSSFEDGENFTCHAALSNDQEKEMLQVVRLERYVPVEIVSIRDEHRNVTQPANLTCVVKGFPIVEIKWEKFGDTFSQK